MPRIAILAFPGVQPLDVAGPVEAVALRCGFGTAETLRRTFARRLGVSPSSYRQRFRGAA